MSASNKKTRRENRIQRRIVRKERPDAAVNERFNFTLKNIKPLTENQRYTFEAYEDGQHLLLVGTAGTGKSFLSIYLGMNDIMNTKTYEKMIIVRSIVPTRDMGYLPGTEKDKAKVYEAPYYAIFSELFGRGDSYEYLKSKHVVEFMTTSFVRGITINNAIVIVDEFQNMNPNELHSVITRIGKNCRITFAGDIKQNDMDGRKDVSGFRDFFKVINRMDSFDVVEFNRNDIVRGEIVKEYIVAREELEELGAVATL